MARLGSVASIQRLAEIIAVDTLSLENSVARNRVLLGLITAATRLVEAEREAGLAWEAE